MPSTYNRKLAYDKNNLFITLLDTQVLDEDSMKLVIKHCKTGKPCLLDQRSRKLLRILHLILAIQKVIILLGLGKIPPYSTTICG